MKGFKNIGFQIYFYKKQILIFSSVLSFFLLTGYVKEVASIFSGLTQISDTVTDIDDAVLEEKMISKKIQAFQSQKDDIENSLRELDYTESEIKSILEEGGMAGNSNPLDVLRRASQNIKRVKSLMERLRIIKEFNPDSATAAYSAVSVRSLSDIKLLLAQIVYNQNRDYKDRLLQEKKESLETKNVQNLLHEESLRMREGQVKGARKSPSNNSLGERVKSWWSNGHSN